MITACAGLNAHLCLSLLTRNRWCWILKSVIIANTNPEHVYKFLLLESQRISSDSNTTKSPPLSALSFLLPHAQRLLLVSFHHWLVPQVKD
jgi:hypothetical protein